MKTPKASDVKKGISVLWETLQCPICLDLMTAPVSTKCDHQFCKFCMTKLLDKSKQNKANCPVCKTAVTKRSLQESPGFQRLVAGLQDMIHAYEHDTGTNYFTGTSQQRRYAGVPGAETTEDTHNLSSGDTRGTDLDRVENADCGGLPQSHSSTIAAQNGFARLMGLEDSAPLTTENEAVDSGLGDAPPTSEKKMSSPVGNVEPVQAEMSDIVEKTIKTCKNRGKMRLENASLCPSLIPEENKQQPLRKSSRKKQKKDAKPDKILDQKRKKSLEKVAEWLMKVPADGSIELEKPDVNSDDSDSSSTSTIDIRQCVSEVNPKREARAKALEEQVFGAVYKRRANRTVSPPLDVFAEPPTAKETSTHEDASAVREENVLTLVKINQSNMEEEEQMTEEINDAGSGVFKPAEKMEVRAATDADTHVDELNHVSVDKNISRDEVPSLVSDILEQQPAAKMRKRMCNVQQEVDGDLQEQAQAKSAGIGQKKTDKRKGRNTRSEKGKPARVPKPLVLVGVQNGEISPVVRARAREVQIQIENYPSSEDQETPVSKSTRGSRRLKLFAEQVQKGHKKASVKARVPEKNNGIAKQSEHANGEALDGAEHETNMATVAKRNGCVYDQDIGGIENAGSAERTSNLRPTGAVKESVAENPNAASSSTRLSDATLGSDKQDNIQLETSVCETKCAEPENEEDNNDSELDTEQLLRSFKATKRKSFHLGSPDVKRSRGLDKESVKEPEESRAACSGVESAEKALRDADGSSCDFISPSSSPVRPRRTVSEKPDQAVVAALIPESSCSGEDMCRSRSSPSSALSPNKESKREAESPPLSVVPQVVDSGLSFTAVDHEELKEASEITESRADRREVKGIEDDAAATLKYTSVNTTDHIAVAESSLTPDDLVASPVQTFNKAETNSGDSREASLNSSIKSNPKRKRRAQRLEPSSESDSSGSKEELPTLTQIFGTSARPAVVNPNRSDSSDDNRCEGTADAAGQLSRPPACSSPDCINSSQASVDLFGTPDECDVPVNDTVESSQFSSEVLVTQQKIEMQKELVRLEKLMALVSEVLQEKEGSPSKEIPSEAHWSTSEMDPDVDRQLLCNKDVGQGSDRKDVAEAGPDLNPSDLKGVPEPNLSKPEGVTQMEVQQSMHKVQSGKGTGASKTPSATSEAKMQKDCRSPSDGQEDKENNSPPKDARKCKLVLVSSGLDSSEQIMVKKFAKRVGARVVSQVTPEVTHVIMRTDEQLVCERTLKYFLGIAGRKWVVSFQWISECFKQKKLLDESPFEVRGDVVNGTNHQGPSRARTTEDCNLLMRGFRICFQGPFTDMTTDEMEWMVELCGAAVVKDPILLDGKQKSHQLIIVQPKPESLSSVYSSLSKQATVLTRGWLLDTVATYTLQNYSSYRT